MATQFRSVWEGSGAVATITTSPQHLALTDEGDTIVNGAGIYRVEFPNGDTYSSNIKFAVLDDSWERVS